MIDTNAFYNRIKEVSEWTPILLHHYHFKHQDWLRAKELEYGKDYRIYSWREPFTDTNIHMRAFKDPAVAMLFALKFR